MAVKRILCACVALLAAACASGPKPDELFLSQLRASPDHSPLRLMIVPVQAPLVGEHVFYVQEMAADNVARVLAQRLYVVNAVPDKQMAVLIQADLAEPLRWRDGHLKSNLFQSMLAQDVRVRAGCDLLFKREGSGCAAALIGNCRGSARDTGEALRVEQRVTLNADGIAIFEQQRDAAGKLVYGDEPDPWYRYARRADTPW
jgi:hypothetical protein